jgi:uncharacterized protein YaeQ
MALTATIYRMQIVLSDVDRNVYETLDLRLAQHPSETARYLLTRAIAYALSYEEGIAFSKGGVSSTDEAPISIFDATGALTAWIDIGAPSAERLHKAAKAAHRVEVYTTRELTPPDRPIHRAGDIRVWKIDPKLIEALEARLERNLKLELTRTDGRLYVTMQGTLHEGTIELRSLGDQGP